MINHQDLSKHPKVREMIHHYKEDDAIVKRLAADAEDRYYIDPELYGKHEVKRGLRDANGKGVVAGLTNIGSVVATKKLEDGTVVPTEGELYYRGIPIEELVQGFLTHNRFGFEEIVYLLMVGHLPNEQELQEFYALMADYEFLPSRFNSGVIMKVPSDNIMNTMAKCTLALHSYDPWPNDISIPNVMRQCFQLIARFPSLAVYGYQASMYFRKGESMFIQKPNPKLSLAENLLYMLRPDGKYTELEAKILDLCLVLHAEHGGGNNSTFTVHVVTSSGTDTYATMAAALGSLKGPKHGGANIKVMEQFEDLKQHVSDWTDEEALRAYLRGLLNKEGFDHSGLIYGMGHAVYSISDPRAVILKGFVEKLSIEKKCHEEYLLYSTVERLATEEIMRSRNIYKGVCANVDFYSGFVYKMLGIPVELYTPLFAIARIAGWSAHRVEELINSNKIIRPAYLAVSSPQTYQALEER